MFSLNYTWVSRAKLHRSASGSRFYTLQCSIQAAALYTINKVTKKSPTENCFCQITCPSPHPATATTHSKSVWTASLFFSVLVVPCYFGCFNPAMAARSANNNANVFLYLFHVPAHSPRWWQHQTIFPLSVSPNQIKPSSQFCQLTPQSLFSLTASSQLSSTGLYCFLVTVLQLNFTVWQNQAMSTAWNTVIGSVKDIEEKVRQYRTSSVLERRVPHLYYVWVSWITEAPADSASYD